MGIMLVLVGVGLVGYPYYFHWEQEKEMEELHFAIHAISSGEELNDAEISLSIKKQIENGVMRLKIPSIDLNQPVLPETSEESLNLALTQIKANQTPGEGNFTIAGHRSTKEGRHFNRLPKVKEGETVILIEGSKEYHYTINNVITVKPERVDVLKDVEGQDLITLVTCTITGADRIIVQGKLEDIKESKSINTKL